MKKFSLEEYLKNPDRKVVTRSGDEATIIYTKANKEWPVVALNNSSIEAGLVWQFSADGESMTDNDGSIYYGGLFFADEEEELTEFEKAIKDMGHSVMFMTTECIKQKAKELLDIAFAEFKEREALHIIGEAKEEGRLEVLRYLPKWKKTKLDRCNAFGAGPWYPSGIGQDGGKHTVFINGYEISVDELFDKLPKED